jgi:hypothetical protein
VAHREILTLNRSNHRKESKTMGAGGIIQQRNAVLLTAATDPSMYQALSPQTKTAVDSIDAKDPMTRTDVDLKILLRALQEACGC